MSIKTAGCETSCFLLLNVLKRISTKVDFNCFQFALKTLHFTR